MKIIMLRDLDLPEKKDVADIVRQYMTRPRVATTAATVAVESLIRQFDRNEKENLEYRRRTERQLEELREQVARLTWERSVGVSKIKTFRAAFKDLMSDG